MTLTLLADAALRPYLEQLIPYSPHDFRIVYLSSTPPGRQRQIAHLLETTGDCDAIVLLDGVDLIPEDGWQAGEIPLILPNVHNMIALLLGGRTAYRRLFEQYQGGICWALPGQRTEHCTTVREDCHLLCLLADAQLNLPDDSVYAQMIAQYNNWDFIRVPTNLSLLESLLGGNWSGTDYLVVQPGEVILPFASTVTV